MGDLTMETSDSTDGASAAGASVDDRPDAAASVFDSIKGSRDALTVRRVFGDPQELGEVTLIPVARVAGGGGGGGGESDGREDPDGDGAGSGFGSGYGLRVSPIGVYEVRGDSVDWKPSVDVNRLIRGGQVLAGIITVCLTIVLVRRRSP